MKPIVKLWRHQEEGLARAKDMPYFALFFEMGAGKTATIVNILRWKFLNAGRIMRTLYFGPPIIIQNTRREFQMHSRFGDKVVCLEGSGKKRAELVREYRDKPTVFLANYQTLLMPEVYALLNDWQPEVIVFDESHKLKNIKAKRTKLAIRLGACAKHKYLLTGTPILNNAMDLFPQYLAMDGGATFGKNFFVFRAEYFDDKNALMPKAKYFPNWQLQPGALERLNAAIKPSSMVVKKADCMDLPPLVKQVVTVGLSPVQAKLYKQMKDDFIAYVGSSACVATLAITKALRLQQIVSGFVTLVEEGEDPRNVSLKENPRAEALKELLSDITPGAKCLVWCVFRENYATVRAVCEALKVKYVEVHGGISASGKQAAVDQFNTDPDIRVFIGHPASGGIGINLVSASYCIFYSRGFSLEFDLQAEARNYRGGSEMHSKVTRIDLVAEGTIDEQISTALANKFEIGERILKDIAKGL